MDKSGQNLLQVSDLICNISIFYNQEWFIKSFAVVTSEEGIRTDKDTQDEQCKVVGEKIAGSGKKPAESNAMIDLNLINNYSSHDQPLTCDTIDD